MLMNSVMRESKMDAEEPQASGRNKAARKAGTSLQTRRKVPLLSLKTTQDGQRLSSSRRRSSLAGVSPSLRRVHKSPTKQKKAGQKMVRATKANFEAFHQIKQDVEELEAKQQNLQYWFQVLQF